MGLSSASFAGDSGKLESGTGWPLCRWLALLGEQAFAEHIQQLPGRQEFENMDGPLRHACLHACEDPQSLT